MKEADVFIYSFRWTVYTVSKYSSSFGKCCLICSLCWMALVLLLFFFWMRRIIAFLIFLKKGDASIVLSLTVINFQYSISVFYTWGSRFVDDSSNCYVFVSTVWEVKGPPITWRFQPQKSSYRPQHVSDKLWWWWWWWIDEFLFLTQQIIGSRVQVQ